MKHSQQDPPYKQPNTVYEQQANTLFWKAVKAFDDSVGQSQGGSKGNTGPGPSSSTDAQTPWGTSWGASSNAHQSRANGSGVEDAPLNIGLKGKSESTQLPAMQAPGTSSTQARAQSGNGQSANVEKPFAAWNLNSGGPSVKPKENIELQNRDVTHGRAATNTWKSNVQQAAASKIDVPKIFSGQPVSHQFSSTGLGRGVAATAQEKSAAPKKVTFQSQPLTRETSRSDTANADNPPKHKDSIYPSFLTGKFQVPGKTQTAADVAASFGKPVPEAGKIRLSPGKLEPSQKEAARRRHQQKPSSAAGPSQAPPGRSAPPGGKPGSSQFAPQAPFQPAAPPFSSTQSVPWAGSRIRVPTAANPLPKPPMTPLERLASEDFQSPGSPMDMSPVYFPPATEFNSNAASRLSQKVSAEQSPSRPNPRDVSSRSYWDAVLKKQGRSQAEDESSAESFEGSSSGWSADEDENSDTEDGEIQQNSFQPPQKPSSPPSQQEDRFKFKVRTKQRRSSSNGSFGRVKRPAGLGKERPENDADGLANDFANVKTFKAPVQLNPPSNFEKQFNSKIFLGDPGRTPARPKAAAAARQMPPRPPPAAKMAASEIIDLSDSTEDDSPSHPAEKIRAQQYPSGAPVNAGQTTDKPVNGSSSLHASSVFGQTNTVPPPKPARSIIDLTGDSESSEGNYKPAAAKRATSNLKPKTGDQTAQSRAPSADGVSAPLPRKPSESAQAAGNPFSGWNMPETSARQTDTTGPRDGVRSSPAKAGVTKNSPLKPLRVKPKLKFAKPASPADKNSSLPQEKQSPPPRAPDWGKWAAYAKEMRTSRAENEGTEQSQQSQPNHTEPAEANRPVSDAADDPAFQTPAAGTKTAFSGGPVPMSGVQYPEFKASRSHTSPMTKETFFSTAAKDMAEKPQCNQTAEAPFTDKLKAAENRDEQREKPGGVSFKEAPKAKGPSRLFGQAVFAAQGKWPPPASRLARAAAQTEPSGPSEGPAKPDLEDVPIVFRDAEPRENVSREEATESPSDAWKSAGPSGASWSHLEDQQDSRVLPSGREAKPSVNLFQAGSWSSQNGMDKPFELKMGATNSDASKTPSSKAKRKIVTRGVGRQNIPPNTNAQPSLSSGVAKAPDGKEQLVRKAQEKAKALHKQGNDHHTKGEFDKAIEMYKQAIVTLHSVDMKKESAVLYNNLAAVSITTDRPAAALHYCNQALQADPGFLKAHMRAGTAHWKLGDLDAALKRYEFVCSQPSAPPDAASKLAELKQFALSKAKGYDSLRAATDPESAQKNYMEGPLVMLQTSPACQDLLSLSAHSLLQLNRAQEAMNLASARMLPGETGLAMPVWPKWVITQALFLQGNLKEAADALDGYCKEQAASTEAFSKVGQVITVDGTAMTSQELAATANALRELLAKKEAGNSAVARQAHAEAVTAYTEGIAMCGQASPAFAAVLHGNRAAAHQALGNNADAIADCLRARALNPAYLKASSRLATLYSDCGFHSTAVTVLTDMEEHLKKQGGDVREVKLRVLETQNKARAIKQGDPYKLLGLARTCEVDEVKKVYKKLALKFHPDKAMASCKFGLSISPSSIQIVTRSQTEGAIREAANSLFQQIGAAHSVLTDPHKRREVDAELNYSSLYANFPGTNRSQHRGSKPQYRPAAYNAYNSFRRGQASSYYSRPAYQSKAGKSSTRNASSYYDDSDDDDYHSKASWWD